MRPSPVFHPVYHIRDSLQRGLEDDLANDCLANIALDEGLEDMSIYRTRPIPFLSSSIFTLTSASLIAYILGKCMWSLFISFQCA